MPVTIQSNIAVSRFWQDVTKCLDSELDRRDLKAWRVTLQPRSDTADYFSKDPTKEQKLAWEGKASHQSGPDLEIDESKRTATLSFPGTGSFAIQFRDSASEQLTAEAMALDLADYLQLTVGDTD